MELFLVREDRDGRSSGAPVVLPRASLGSYLRTGSALKASKCEAPHEKRSPPIMVRPVRDYHVDRSEV